MNAQAWVQLAVGVGAIVGVLVTWRQKNDADRRSEWWRRTAWAFERTFNEDDTQAELGLKLLALQVESKLMTRDEKRIVLLITKHIAAVDDTPTLASEAIKEGVGDSTSEEASPP